MAKSTIIYYGDKANGKDKHFYRKAKTKGKKTRLNRNDLPQIVRRAAFASAFPCAGGYGGTAFVSEITVNASGKGSIGNAAKQS